MKWTGTGVFVFVVFVVSETQPTGFLVTGDENEQEQLVQTTHLHIEEVGLPLDNNELNKQTCLYSNKARLGIINSF